MSVFTTFFDSVVASNEKRARVLVLNELRAMSARNLVDLGFDSRLLAKGVQAWPWRFEESDDTHAIPSFIEASYQAETKEAAKSINTKGSAEIGACQTPAHRASKEEERELTFA